MKRLYPLSLPLLVAFVLGMTIPCRAAEAAVGRADKIRLLVVHGGHDFETNQFFQVFKDNPSVTFKVVAHPQAQEWFKPERAGEYDVLVFYDMWQTISDEAKANLMTLLKQGKGLLAMHHCLASFPDWTEYSNIIGGKYHQKKWTDNGLERPASTYKHDVDFKVHIAEPRHAVTRGIKDFVIHDETYGGFEVKPESQVLLTTDEPTSGRALAWAKTYGDARVVYVQLGHDHQAYENPNYRQLVGQAIRWVAKRD
jgi:type 1 glutamine amidotransferase